MLHFDKVYPPFNCVSRKVLEKATNKNTLQRFQLFNGHHSKHDANIGMLICKV